MLFATRKKPKGPNLNKMEEHNFVLSGNAFSVHLPYGNCFDIPNPAGTFHHNRDIYNHESLNKQSEASLLIADRPYKYSGFMGENLGRIRFLVQSHLIQNPQLDLLKPDNLKSHIENVEKKSCDEWNETADETAQIHPPSQYENRIINNRPFTTYETSSISTERNYYATAISHNCYLTIEFIYTVAQDSDEPWFSSARELENTIIQTVHFTTLD